MIEFHEFLRERLEGGGFSTEDALASFLPLARQVIRAHDADQVAPLEGLDALRVEGVTIWFEEAHLTEPVFDRSKVRELERPASRGVEIVEETHRTSEVTGEEEERIENLRVGRRGEEITRPVYLPGYVSWEHEIGHHDPVTDIYSLGLILASLACGIDLAAPEELEAFVNGRRNLFELNRLLHPVLAKAIFRMTELHRRQRPQDLTGLVQSLENYRDQDVDIDFDLAGIDGFRDQDLIGKRQIVLSKLRERLFEISRRNRLLHFRPTMQSVNLTHASVPLSFDVRSITPEDLLTWDGRFHEVVVAGKPISLNRYLRFDEALYLPSVLDRIRAEARRDQAEFGFAQLRLVVCFLRWFNLKERPPERFDSPLVLLPVKLQKKKGVRDSYWLEPLGTEAEINPVLRHYLKQLYDIDLPEVVDLTASNLDALHEYLERKIQASDPAVTLEKIDKPRIDVLHERARRRLDQYRRRIKLAGRRVRSFLDIDYSYHPDNYHPLGLRIFQSRIRRPETQLRALVGADPAPRQFMVAEPGAPSLAMSGPSVEVEKQFYTLREESAGGNPYAWEFDLCSVTLANFKYRKMSLVRDFSALLENDTENVAFDSIFSLVPRPVDDDVVEPLPLEERYHVVPCDPTQSTAISKARDGVSYIIQGPPGTGKSQTITNLIADYVGRGQRVLFVCEKRAAIDVVYHRLRQCGLDELCCLIHDSQADKKEFIQDLKRTYEAFLEPEGDGQTSWEEQRSELLRCLRRELKPIARYNEAMLDVPERAGTRLRDLLRRLVELQDHTAELSDLERERLPYYDLWVEHRQRIERFAAALGEIQADGILAHHPLRRLSPDLVDAERPLETITKGIDTAEGLLGSLEETLGRTSLPPELRDTLEKVLRLAEYASRVRFLAENNHFELVDRGSAASKRFDGACRDRGKRLAELLEAREAARAWQQKLPPDETEIALEQARALEGQFLAFLRPAWWRLRGVLKRCYDFRSHMVRPTWTRVLEQLAAEHHAEAAVRESEAAIREEFRIDGELADFLEGLEWAREGVRELADEVRSTHERLLAAETPGEAADIVVALLDGAAVAERLERSLVSFLDGIGGLTFEEIRSDLGAIEDELDELQNFLHCLAEVAALPPSLAGAFRDEPLSVPQFEAAAARRSVEHAYRADRALERFDARKRDRHLSRLEKAHDEWQEVNAGVVRDRVRRRFLEHVRIASLPAAQLEPAEKEFKKLYKRGRRELEHEFGKSMRYKSIRDLAAGNSGAVIRDLKPVWLMSPLSVSDTLPLDADGFDVVIFDEASQITVEEAVPSVYRSEQIVVVGDEMQLPPTNFFSAKRSEEEERVWVEEGGDVVEYDLDSNSFLSQAGRKLSSTMLGWHYRSRSESLISFSNAAFYEGGLLTVPDDKLAAASLGEIRVVEPAQGADNVADLLERAVSFHFLGNGRYQKRRNRAEADYIAHLVRGLLVRRKESTEESTQAGKPSIGIVAFSEAQQDEIESALERLAQADRGFRELLEAEYEREEDDQYVGLLVKNLENIQGDERDIVILSVCYGFDPQGKMRMHFGPINQRGGEKRLNVAFSRAKCHMAVVSSIQYTDIKNDYNDGANCLKNYLRYADAVSHGDATRVRRVLEEMVVWRDGARRGGEPTADAVVEELAGALRQRQYDVDRDVGQSHFRCDLAIRRDGDDAYRLGILVDTDVYYAQTDLIERDLMRPKLLRAFGWKIATVLTKDWCADREAVLTRLEKELRG